MSLTVTYDTPRSERISRNIGIVTGTISFDNSYPYGGESLDLSSKFRDVFMVVFENKSGYKFEYDATNDKVKVFTAAPPIVFEEKHTAVGNSVTLDYPAAWIINVATAGQNEALTAMADTLADNECQLTAAIADGERTGITTYGATDTIYVTYVTQAWVDLYRLLVQEETVTLATGTNDLTYAPMGLGYVYADTTGLLLPVDISDTTAAGEVGIDFTVAAGDGTAAIDINAAQNTEVATVTYLKKPSSGWIADRLVADEDPAKAGSDPYTQAYDFPLLLWLLTGCHTVNSGATQTIIESGATAAAGEINMLNWSDCPKDLLAAVGAASTAGHVWGAKSNVTCTAGCYLKGRVWEIPGIVPLEAKDTTNLEGLTNVKFVAYGYTNR